MAMGPGADEWGDTGRMQRIGPGHLDGAHESAPSDGTVPPQPTDERERYEQGQVERSRPGIARLLTVGVGGAGTNAVNHMIEAGVPGVEFLVMNTDAQALETARTPNRLRLGETLTRGLGAGGNPETGRRAAEESFTAIREALRDADMVFITAGMGGGTGTGAGPLVAQAAREVGALTVAVVTTPFAFERRRKIIAEQGLPALREMVDALIVVPNERLLQLAGSDMGAFAAYKMADDVLRQGIQGISDLITIPGLINLDFADIKVVMADAGTALMSIGQASGENRAEEAARKAMTNPLLEVDISGARGVIFNVAGSDDLTMGEVQTIAEIISDAAHADASITFGTVYDPSIAGSLKVTVVATGFEPRVAYDRQQHARAKSAAPAAGPFTAPQSAGNGLVHALPPQQPEALPPAPEVLAGGLQVRAPAPPMSRRDGFAITPLERTRTSDQDGLPAPHASRGDEQIRLERRHVPLRPGYHGDEFLANDEPEQVEAPPVPRGRWEQLFGRH